MNEFDIQTIPLFAALPADELGLLSKTLCTRDFLPGSVLFQENEIGDRFSIILQGKVDVVKALGTADERVLAVVGPGDFIGEMSLLYRDRQRSASARARTEVRLLEMTQEDFDAMLKRQPVLAFRIMQEMSTRLRNSEDATIRDLQEKNQQLARAYRELQAAQAQLIEKEKMEHELRMARRIQERILPKEIPSLQGWQLAAYWQPARAVSGDFYDFIPFPKGKLGIVIGDVTDKGVPAALVMATTRSVLRAAAIGSASLGNISPGKILAQVNDLLCPDMPANMFVTCLLGILDPESGQLRFANAGHDLPFQRTANEVIELRARGMPLGLLPGMQYDENETSFAPGDCLLMYSDGLVEAHNPQGEMFSFPRLQADMANQPGSIAPTGQELIKYLLEKLARFTGPDWEQEDDVTFVTLHRFPHQ